MITAIHIGQYKTLVEIVLMLGDMHMKIFFKDTSW